MSLQENGWVVSTAPLPGWEKIGEKTEFHKSLAVDFVVDWPAQSINKSG